MSHEQGPSFQEAALIHVTYMKESCNMKEAVLSHIYMSHEQGPSFQEAALMHVTYMNETHCRAIVWILIKILNSQRYCHYIYSSFTSELAKLLCILTFSFTRT